MIAPRSFSAGPQSPPNEVARQPTLQEQLHDVRRQREKIRLTFAKLEWALATEKITKAEYDFFVKKSYAGKPERELVNELQKREHQLEKELQQVKHAEKFRPNTAAFVLLIFILGLGSVLFFNPGGVTGLVTLDPISEVVTPVDYFFNESGNLTLNITNTTALTIGGELDGNATVHLIVNSTQYLVYTAAVELDPYRITTEMTSYALNSSINITVVPESANHTLWLTLPSGEKELVHSSHIVTVPGDYILDALIDDAGAIEKASTSFTVRNETNSSNDIPREEVSTILFEDECAETCSLDNTGAQPLTLHVTLTSGTLRITEMRTTASRGNVPPTQLALLPDVSLLVGQRRTLELDNYFTDADGEQVNYDFMNLPGVSMDVSDGTLTIIGVAPGSGQSVIFASDLLELIQSNQFTITVVANETNATNATGNASTLPVTPPVTPPTSTNTTPAASNTSTNITIDPEVIPEDLCKHADPNKRPVECLQEQAAIYFQPQALYISDTNRNPIARLTPIGNLLIQGEVQENAAFTADRDDYVIGYEDAFGEYHSTVWFDAESGNLYLAGNLYEEHANSAPAPGSYVLKNKRGIILAWATQATGDLYIRGNVIPYRRSIE